MKFTKILYILIIIISPKYLFSQESIDTGKNYFVSAKTYYGFVYAHHPEIKYITEGKSHSAEINLGIKTSGKKQWHHAYNFPSIGLGYFYSDLGNPVVLGKVHSIYGFVNGNIINIKKYSFNYHLAIGISYLPKHFDYKTNHLNFAVGTPFNVHGNLLFEHKYQLNDKLQISGGLGVAHFSNGAVKMPNLGINLINLSAGVRYYFRKQNISLIKKQLSKFKNKFDFFVIQSFGIQSSYPVSSRRYLASSFVLNFGRQFGYKTRIGVGLDVFYDGIVQKSYMNSEVYDSKPIDYMSSGSHLSYDIVYGKTYFTIQQGIHIFGNEYKKGKLFNRFGLRFKIKNHLIANITLFTYFARAENIELGVGYYF